MIIKVIRNDFDMHVNIVKNSESHYNAMLIDSESGLGVSGKIGFETEDAAIKAGNSMLGIKQES